MSRRIFLKKPLSIWFWAGLDCLRGCALIRFGCQREITSIVKSLLRAKEKKSRYTRYCIFCPNIQLKCWTSYHLDRQRLKRARFSRSRFQCCW
jgi:hypothetical protein